MPAALALYITKYGYLAIFGLIFVQELGVPNPVPNEIILLFSGYLTSVNILSFPLVFLTATSADFIGTTVLYTVFYHFGELFLKRKPRWLPISREKIDRLGERISKKDQWGVYLGRLLPYLRGYVSVAAGLIKIRPRVFLASVFLSAMTWSGGYVILGNSVGPYWDQVAAKLGGIENILISAIGALVVILVCRYFIKRHKRIR